jgi:hypothetical protein
MLAPSTLALEVDGVNMIAGRNLRMPPRDMYL